MFYSPGIVKRDIFNSANFYNTLVFALEENLLVESLQPTNQLIYNNNLPIKFVPVTFLFCDDTVTKLKQNKY